MLPSPVETHPKAQPTAIVGGRKPILGSKEIVAQVGGKEAVRGNPPEEGLVGLGGEIVGFNPAILPCVQHPVIRRPHRPERRRRRGKSPKDLSGRSADDGIERRRQIDSAALRRRLRHAKVGGFPAVIRPSQRLDISRLNLNSVQDDSPRFRVQQIELVADRGPEKRVRLGEMESRPQGNLLLLGLLDVIDPQFVASGARRNIRQLGSITRPGGRAARSDGQSGED